MNNLSAELDVLRPSMLQTGLQIIAHNINRKNTNICFYEFGKTYGTTEVGKYTETNHLCFYTTGNKVLDTWNTKAIKTDIYFIKGVLKQLLSLVGISMYNTVVENNSILFKKGNDILAEIKEVEKADTAKMDIKQPVFFADINWDKITKLTKKQKLMYAEITKYPAVQRDLAIVVDKTLTYEQIENATYLIKLNKLKNLNLFDVFESEKLGIDKKSMAVSFTFLDEGKTLTDKEIDSMMSKIIASYEKELGAEIRK